MYCTCTLYMYTDPCLINGLFTNFYWNVYGIVLPFHVQTW